jgi:hypothetical protein
VIEREPGIFAWTAAFRVGEERAVLLPGGDVVCAYVAGEATQSHETDEF